MCKIIIDCPVDNWCVIDIDGMVLHSDRCAIFKSSVMCFDMEWSV